MTITINNKEYTEVETPSLCAGCAAEEDAELCASLPACGSVIFKEVLTNNEKP